MPLIHKEGKDTIIFASKEDHAVPSKINLPDPEPSPGLLLPNGEINWNCPCLGGMPTGPCGLEFREAFSCFHYSTADPKGSDCRKIFETMQDCMLQYPALYESKGAPADDLDDETEEAEEADKKLSASNEEKKKAMVASQDEILETTTEKRMNTSRTKQEVERTKTN
ncbi:Mitochondrial intermembrane space import and assembly protein 40 [Formica fusca]|uniref:mitochondrial intermembrane space import and assembly protein 40-like n=1 Tax=Formica exsecta TaxID=72781 RepID=UPI0011437AC9|nr:mitochondrial intermembrane space import and assembly protein 40-like [Formica exsecta]XP_029661323.1 mitochondrial intermembrane space import and assembly protein 40-like [Formica exsecta]XP_029661324.1 mitochondrial intermembrane space import and assembly protein 40-like [Formica exsecta]XP_029661325.1 mitochondrial intermembrane space import and assembly protein 40-like [Formica exsecta]